jgi:hypothetical protein
MSCQMTEAKDLSSFVTSVPESLPLPENSLISVGASGALSSVQRPVVTTMSGDFDPSSVVNNIRRMMTDPLKPETLRPVVPPFMAPLRERPVREEMFQKAPEKTKPSIQFNSPLSLPVKTKEQTKPTPFKPEQHMSQSRELVPYNRSLKHVLSTFVRNRWGRTSGIAVAGVVLIGGLAALFVGLSTHVQSPSSTLVASSTPSTPAQTAAVAESQVTEPKVAEPKVDWKKGVVASSGGAGASVAASNPTQAAPSESLNAQVGKKPEKENIKTGEMGLRVGETLSEPEITPTHNAYSVRTVKVETITLKPPVENPMPRLSQPIAETKGLETKNNTRINTARNDANVPTIEAPKTEIKMAPKVELSKTASKIIEKPAETPLEKPVQKTAESIPPEKKAVEPVATPTVVPAPASTPVTSPISAPAVVSNPTPVKPIQHVGEAAKPTTPPVTAPRLLAPVVLAPVAVASVVAVTPSPSVFDRLVTRADALIKQGAIVDARQLLSRAAEDGHAKAAFRLAETYDARILETWGVRGGVKGETQKARIYYQQALSGGMSEAQTRLEQLK